LEKNEALNNENWKLKEEKQRLIDTQSGGVLKVKVNVSKLYTGLFINLPLEEDESKWDPIWHLPF
jgi:hypothetical protein